ncbi:MAG TPA: hypothetical protein VGQ59_20855 [Cyclobacteriaceae bacterium]|nr:hypothetical protein [Cyclobacteriaceae bacterium]
MSNAELLKAWEAGLERPMLDATLFLLATSYSVNSSDIGRLSIGDRDVRLLQLREWLFGHRLNNLAKCPACGELIEWECDLKEFYFQPVSSELSSRQYLLERENIHIHFRLPNSLDIVTAISRQWNSNAVLSNCIIEVYEENKKSSLDILTDEMWSALDEKMSELDPQADIKINLSCPVCSNHWQTSFDIVSYLWTEINNWAQRMVQEVYTLARAFGWSEKEILEMSTYRRELYVEMLRT